MIPLGLSAKDERLFNQSLTRSHPVKFRVYILDLNHNHLEDVSDRFLDGQVNVDTTKSVTRDLSMTLADRGLMSFESGNFSTGSNFATRMVQVYYGVSSDLLNRWVWVPVFCGPITSFSRDDAVVSIQASGKESLLETKVWTARSYRKGTLKTTVLRDFLTRNGETRLDIPSTWKTKTDKDITIGADQEVWDRAQSIARSWGAGKLLYDGRGRCRLFTYSSASRWTFKGGPGGSLQSKPRLSYTMGDTFTNAARVYGATPQGKTAPVFAQYVAPADHPLSPQSMRRGGQPLYFAQVLRDSNVTTQADAAKLAKSLVNNGLIQSVQVEVETLPIPHLEPWDVVTLTHDSYSTPFSLTRFSLPLNDSGQMTIGYNARVSRWTKKR